MSDNALRLILQILGAVLGGGLLQFIRSLFVRKAEIKALDAKADADTVTAQTAYIELLQKGESTLRVEIERLGKEILQLRREIDQGKEDHTEAMNRSLSENVRLRDELARVKSDLSVTQSQVDSLSSELRRRI